MKRTIYNVFPWFVQFFQSVYHKKERMEYYLTLLFSPSTIQTWLLECVHVLFSPSEHGTIIHKHQRSILTTNISSISHIRRVSCILFINYGSYTLIITIRGLVCCKLFLLFYFPFLFMKCYKIMKFW
jgi:hypothetical protein